MPQMRPAQFELDYSHPLARDLVHAWLGANPGGPQYIDSGPHKNHATLEYSASWLHNKPLFSGASAAAVADFTRVNPSAGTVTVRFTPNWTTGLTASNHYIFDTYGGNNQRFILWYSYTAAETMVYTQTNKRTTAWTPAWNAGTTYTVTTHWPANVVYVDGTQDADGSDADLGTSASSLYLGARYTFGETADSTFDFFMIHNRVLTPTEIAVLADQSDPTLGGLIKPTGDLHAVCSPYNWEGVR